MSSTTFLVGMVVFIFVYAWYSANKLHNKIHIFYKRVDRALLEKDVKLGSKIIKVYDKEYKVLPDRIGVMEWKKGIHAILPIWRQYLIYDWDDEFPQNPDSYKQKIMSPDVRNLINQEARMGAFAKGIREQSVGKKVTGLTQYLPMIALGGVIILLFFLYTMNNHITALEKLIPGGR